MLDFILSHIWTNSGMLTIRRCCWWVDFWLVCLDKDIKSYSFVFPPNLLNRLSWEQGSKNCYPWLSMFGHQLLVVIRGCFSPQGSKNCYPWLSMFGHQLLVVIRGCFLHKAQQGLTPHYNQWSTSKHWSPNPWYFKEAHEQFSVALLKQCIWH